MGEGREAKYGINKILMKKVAIVTGGTKGLGLMIAKELSKAGYLVYAPSRKPRQNIKNVFPVTADITKESEF